MSTAVTTTSKREKNAPTSKTYVKKIAKENGFTVKRTTFEQIGVLTDLAARDLGTKVDSLISNSSKMTVNENEVLGACNNVFMGALEGVDEFVRKAIKATDDYKETHTEKSGPVRRENKAGLHYSVSLANNTLRSYLRLRDGKRVNVTGNAVVAFAAVLELFVVTLLNAGSSYKDEHGSAKTMTSTHLSHGLMDSSLRNYFVQHQTIISGVNNVRSDGPTDRSRSSKDIRAQQASSDPAIQTIPFQNAFRNHVAQHLNVNVRCSKVFLPALREFVEQLTILMLEQARVFGQYTKRVGVNNTDVEEARKSMRLRVIDSSSAPEGFNKLIVNNAIVRLAQRAGISRKMDGMYDAVREFMWRVMVTLLDLTLTYTGQRLGKNVRSSEDGASTISVVDLSLAIEDFGFRFVMPATFPKKVTGRKKGAVKNDEAEESADETLEETVEETVEEVVEEPPKKKAAPKAAPKARAARGARVPPKRANSRVAAPKRTTRA